MGVVADGAGSASRSDQGAAITCSTALEAVEEILLRNEGVAALGAEDAKAIVGMVRARLEERAAELGENVRELACTLLLAVVGADAAFYIQIGDGGIVVSRRDDHEGHGWIFWPESGEYINYTCFVTAADVYERMQTDCATGVVEEVAIFSDGIQSLVLNYAARAVHERFFEQMFTPLRVVEKEGHQLELEKELELFLSRKSIDARTDDDRTLLLASRREILR